MRLRLFLTIGLVLCLATFASSNECFRYCRHRAPAPAAGSAQSARSINGEYSTLLVNHLLTI
jgi:hypothetical protein